jgi:hypothetical protein
VIPAVVASQGRSGKTHAVLVLFGGWTIALVSGTIARFVNPPPRRWLGPEAREPWRAHA